MGSRRLLKEGILLKAKSGRKLYGFLCTDILVLTDEAMRTLYRMVCIIYWCHLSIRIDYTLLVIQPIPLAHARVIGGKGWLKAMIVSEASDDGSR